MKGKELNTLINQYFPLESIRHAHLFESCPKYILKNYCLLILTLAFENYIIMSVFTLVYSFENVTLHIAANNFT